MTQKKTPDETPNERKIVEVNVNTCTSIYLDITYFERLRSDLRTMLHLKRAWKSKRYSSLEKITEKNKRKKDERAFSTKHYFLGFKVNRKKPFV